jgi:hypothetical protein
VTGEDELQREKRGDPQALGRRQPRQQVRRQGGQDREGQGQGARSEDRLDRLPTAGARSEDRLDRLPTTGARAEDRLDRLPTTGARPEDQLARLPTTKRPLNRCDKIVRISSFDLSQRVVRA